MHLAKVKVGLLERRVLKVQLAEPFGGLLELLLILALLPSVEVHEGKVQHSLSVTFLRRLFIELECLIAVTLHTLAMLVADAKIVQCVRASLLRSFFEPLRGLVVIMQFVEEDGTKGVHGENVAFCLRLVVLSDRLLDILLDAQAFIIELALLVKSLSAPVFLVCGLPVKRKCPG